MAAHRPYYQRQHVSVTSSESFVGRKANETSTCAKASPHRSRSVHLRPRTSEGHLTSPASSNFVGFSSSRDNVEPENWQRKCPHRRQSVDVDATAYEEMRVASSPISKNHFRPIRFEVAAELDAFFGMTKAQKRQRALRIKDEDDGTLWFDNFEREECQRLLESALSSPSSHLSDSGPGSPVSVLSTGDNRGFRRRGSSFALAASQLLSLDQGQQLPNNTWMRNGDPMMTIQPTSTDFSSIYTSLPSTVEGHLSQQAQEIEKRTRKTRRHSTIQAANQVGDYLELDLSEDMQLGAKPSSIQMPAFLPLTRRQASAALLAEAFDRPIRQSASFQNWKMPSIEGQEEPVSSPLRARLTTQGRAAPSSLDLVRFEQVGGAMAAASSTMQSTHRRSISDSTVQISASRCERSMTISLSPPATALETHFASEQAQQQRQRGHRIAFRDPFSDVEAGEVMQEKSSVHNSSILSPWSPKVMQQWGKNVERTIRRSSSLDYRCVPSEKQCEGSESPTSNHHKSETTTGSMQQPQRRPMRGEIPSPTKATALLGMNPLNAHLLVPGGLPTGEHVYHGVDIPCAAVHLQSDDEDDEVQGLSSSNAKRGMKGWLSKKIRSGS